MGLYDLGALPLTTAFASSEAVTSHAKKERDVTYSPQPQAVWAELSGALRAPVLGGRGADLEAGLLYACRTQASAPLLTVYLVKCNLYKGKESWPCRPTFLSSPANECG